MTKKEELIRQTDELLEWAERNDLSYSGFNAVCELAMMRAGKLAKIRTKNKTDRGDCQSC